MRKNVAIVVTGGAVSPSLLNKTVCSAARSVRRYGGTPFILSGGYSALLSKGTTGVQELTLELIERWEKQDRVDFIVDRILPKRTKKELKAILTALKSLIISRMIVVGGNGSSFALSALYQYAPDYFRHIVQILKTMDGDCQSPFWNLGFASTLHHANDMMARYGNEMSLYGSPYVIKILGREVGQLALHMGLRSEQENRGLILIREELKGKKLSVEQLTMLLVASALKKLSAHGNFGPLALAEGIIDCLTPEAQKTFGVTSTDQGLTNFTGANLEGVLKTLLTEKFSALGINPFGVPPLIGARCIGYESRAGHPVKEDMELAVEYGNRAGNLATKDKPLPYPTLLRRGDDIDLRSIIDERGEAEQCWVDPASSEYKAFLRHQYRLYPEDLQGESLDRIAGCTNMPAFKVREQLTESAELFASFRRN